MDDLPTDNVPVPYCSPGHDKGKELPRLPTELIIYIFECGGFSSPRFWCHIATLASWVNAICMKHIRTCFIVESDIEIQALQTYLSTHGCIDLAYAKMLQKLWIGRGSIPSTMLQIVNAFSNLKNVVMSPLFRQNVPFSGCMRVSHSNVTLHLLWPFLSSSNTGFCDYKQNLVGEYLASAVTHLRFVRIFEFGPKHKRVITKRHGVDVYNDAVMSQQIQHMIDNGFPNLTHIAIAFNTHLFIQAGDLVVNFILNHFQKTSMIVFVFYILQPPKKDEWIDHDPDRGIARERMHEWLRKTRPSNPWLYVLEANVTPGKPGWIERAFRSEWLTDGGDGLWQDAVQYTELVMHSCYSCILS